jgi:cytochrome c-type biogenesis protein CcmH
MPLAVERLTVSALPALVTLTAAQAMMQGMSLDDVDTVQLVARISESGLANASPDDYEVVSQSIDMTQEQSVIKLIIANRRG